MQDIVNAKLIESADHSQSIQSSASDRRECYRSQFDAQALVGFCVGPELPSPDDFYVVECQDLSGTGLSFHWPVEPLSQRLVVILQKCSGYVSLSAQVVNIRLLKESSPPKVLIGCQFAKRVSMPIGPVIQELLPAKNS